MDIELIRKLVDGLSQIMGDTSVPPEQQFNALQCQLLLHIYEKLDNIESYMKSIDNEIWVPGSGKE